MTESQRLIEALKAFRDERDWAQFHNAKDLALALSIEAAELNELFLWKDADDADPERLSEELADVFAFALLLLDRYDLDLEEIVRRKIEINRENYPAEISRGNADKHH
jgi:NTP pyrophosphatase (non-canonical NTP hydrolase)